MILFRAAFVALYLYIFLSALGVYTDSHASSHRWVRVTYYTLQGYMANGEWVHHGAAACDYSFELGTVIRFDDGREIVCKDRGNLGSSGWIDVWGVADYDTWEVVEVVE